MRHIRLIIAAGLGLIGLVWIGQGFDLIAGSAMTGDRRWAVAGALVLVVAAAVAWSVRRPPPQPPG